MKELRSKGFITRAVHAGEGVPSGNYTPVVTPIHPTVGYVYESMDDLDAVLGATQDGYVYPRYGSPTVAAFERAVAELECGDTGHAFASGMAAIHCALLATGVRAGTAVVAAKDVYGATFTLIQHLLTELGAAVCLVDITNLASVEEALAANHPIALYAETISSPLLRLADIPALAQMAHRHGARLLIDNTYASPYLCNPVIHGADYVINSATKYIAGHGDVLAGVVVTTKENRHTMYELNKMVGGVLGPFEAWLALRGMKTLPLRMRQQCANAMRIAEWLNHHPKVARINYPGLASHPQHELARRLLGERGFGGMLSFEIAGADQAKVFQFMEALQLCLPATTLGDIYTLVMHPASASHRALTPAERATVGIADGLVRISVGIEDADDIIADLSRGLDSV
ncbi:MAG: trans-sulfuration enzyme family protein [Chloroflexota bacterium]